MVQSSIHQSLVRRASKVAHRRGRHKEAAGQPDDAVHELRQRGVGGREALQPGEGRDGEGGADADLVVMETFVGGWAFGVRRPDTKPRLGLDERDYTARLHTCSPAWMARTNVRHTGLNAFSMPSSTALSYISSGSVPFILDWVGVGMDCERRPQQPPA